MIPRDALKLYIGPALYLLPTKMTSPEAQAIMVAIALQESGFRHRRQIGGPARSYWQFELIGVEGVMTHHVTRAVATEVLTLLDYPVADPGYVYQAFEHNQVLAAAFARLLLYSLPSKLPARDEEQLGWQQYLSAWRPGRPHPERWADNWRAAWQLIG